MAGVNAAPSRPRSRCIPGPVPIRDREGTGIERIATESNPLEGSRFSPYDLWGCDRPQGGFGP